MKLIAWVWVLMFSMVGLNAWADDHDSHHPDTAHPDAVAGHDCDAQIAAMRAAHEKFVNAKSSKERKQAQAEERKLMQAFVTDMQAMAEQDGMMPGMGDKGMDAADHHDRNRDHESHEGMGMMKMDTASAKSTKGAADKPQDKAKAMVAMAKDERDHDHDMHDRKDEMDHDMMKSMQERHDMMKKHMQAMTLYMQLTLDNLPDVGK